EEWPMNGIQNGGSDGIALVDDTGQVIQFLSYEGILTAGGGPAMGSTSTDIGVAQTNSTPVGSSLQLTGTGLAYGDVPWATGSSSFGGVNGGQTVDDRPPRLQTHHFVKEIHYANAGDDAGAAIEVARPAESDLSGWSIVLYNGASVEPY